MMSLLCLAHICCEYEFVSNQFLDASLEFVKQNLENERDKMLFIKQEPLNFSLRDKKLKRAREWEVEKAFLFVKIVEKVFVIDYKVVICVILHC